MCINDWWKDREEARRPTTKLVLKFKQGTHGPEIGKWQWKKGEEMDVEGIFRAYDESQQDLTTRRKMYGRWIKCGSNVEAY